MNCKNPIVLTFGLDKRKSGHLVARWNYAGRYLQMKEQGCKVPDYNFLLRCPESKIIFTPDDHYKVDEKDYGKMMLVPCKNCTPCRIARSREWATRCVLEARAFGEENCFITLTYAPEFVPPDLSLHKDDFQKFMKRLRKNTGKKIRYYMCGEYGELNFRPHFHACLFGYKPDDLVLWSVRDGVKLYRSSTLEKAWQYRGFVTVGEVTYESAAYVARYVLKKMTGPVAESHYHGREPEYNAMSLKPGIGCSYFEKFGEEMYERDFVVVRNGIKCKVPRYFDNIYDKYYGDGYFKEKVLPKRISASYRLAARNFGEFSVRRILDRAECQEVKAKQLRRRMEELL